MSGSKVIDDERSQQIKQQQELVKQQQKKQVKQNTSSTVSLEFSELDKIQAAIKVYNYNLYSDLLFRMYVLTTMELIGLL